MDFIRRSRLTGLAAAVLAALGCGNPKMSPVYSGAPNPPGHADGTADPCLATIQTAGFICWAGPLDPTGAGIPSCGPPPANASALSSQYTAQLVAIYQLYPPSLQKIFCTLDHTVILPTSTFYWAAAYPRQDASGIIGATLALNEKVLVNTLSMSDYLHRAATMSFEAGVSITVTAPDIPNVPTPALFNIAHEFGHLLDAYNQSASLIDPQGCMIDSNPYTVQPCPAAPGTFMAMSWVDARTSIFDSTVYPLRTKTFGPFPHGNPLTTGPFIAASMVDETYDELYKSTLISYLGGFQPYDDWAESVAWTVYSSQVHDPVVITTPSGRTFKPIDHLNSPGFSAKKAFVQSILARSDVSTPR
jgi:hypothetical protein